ncbi:Gfo/Idh/MocA family oxidoreductase [Paenibacillus sp.]|uniref:Gfo/Idh/MocA family protein n=1 Tax=Paenibacillus sp. TaxID=58172 RepID=UPI0028113F93|nr:Gfo/Idh/MocA family oxidoreductase [Paenibacillus sp.]
MVSVETQTVTPSKGSKHIKVVLVGAGDRGMGYATHALRYPDEMKIVGVVDPDPARRQRAAEVHGIAQENCFDSVEAFVRVPRFADAAINGTMDPLHVQTSIPLLRAGYDILLEKPIGTSAEEIVTLEEEAKKHGRKVMICHVLRYAPFYSEIRRRIADGEIGDIISMYASEHIRYHHMAVSYIRGKWSNQQLSKTSMLIAKSCHDLDILAWMKSGIAPKRVSSFGGLTHFTKEQAPAGSGERCLVDCQIEASCPYSAQKHHVEMNLWAKYVWPGKHESMTEEEKRESLKTDSPFGRCVWRCDNTVADHQSVSIEFEDGSTAVFNLVGNSPMNHRSLHINGTKGEIQGALEDGAFVIRKYDARQGREYTEERVELNASKGMHGGGDSILIKDFVRIIQGGEPSPNTTSLEDSITSHLVGFAADRSMEEGRWVYLNEYRELT